MKKLLSMLLSLAMVATMLGAFGLTASAKVFEELDSIANGYIYPKYYGIILVDSEKDLETVYNTWKTTDKYDNYSLIMMRYQFSINKSYDFTKEGHALSFHTSSYDFTINKNATLKVAGIEFQGSSAVNYGTVITTNPSDKAGFSTCYINTPSVTYTGLTNYGTIKMLNTDKITCYSNKKGEYPIINNGIIQTPSATISFSHPSNLTDANDDKHLNPESTGSVSKLPIDITSPTPSGDTPLSMSGVAIPAPTYTVTIPTSIDFGDCEKAMANDTQENKIKEIPVDGLAITHSNLFVNEKQVTISMSSDFTIKNGANTLNFELYDGETRLETNAVLITAKPTTIDTAATNSKSLKAKLDKTQIKKNGIYEGTVTFTVALLDVIA